MILRSWGPVLVLVFLIGVFADQPWAVAFSVSVTIIIAAARYWQNHALKNVIYRRKWRYRRGFPGEKLEIQLEIHNRKFLPLSWLRVTDPWPEAVGPEDASILAPSHVEKVGAMVNLVSLRWYDRITRQYSLLLRQRGVFPVGPARLESGDFFGLFDTTEEQKKHELITVYPELVPLSTIRLPAEDPFGDLRTRRRLFEDPNQAIGIRDYQPNDAFRRIHWPATARTGSLQVKVYQPVTSRVMVICLNVSTAHQYWLGFDADLLEHLVKVAATLAFNGVQDGYSVGLVSNGCLAHSDQPFNIPPGRSPNQLSMVLQALAGVTPFTTAPFERYLVTSMPKIPYGSALLIVTAVVTSQLCESLLMLRRYRTHTTLISLAGTPPPDLPGIHMVHTPFQKAVKPSEGITTPQ